MPGSESKLLKGLELGCSGIITATTKIKKLFEDLNKLDFNMKKN